MHHCHAMGCEIPVPPEKLMCITHWRFVPKWIQASVWESYRPGQCDDKQPSRRWVIAATRAICAVAVREGVMTKEQAEDRIESVIERFSEFSVDVSGVSPKAIVSSDASPSSIITEGSGGGTDLRRGAVLIGSRESQDAAQSSTRVEVGIPPTEATETKGHQAGAAQAVEPVPLTSTGLLPFLRWPGGKRWLVDQLVPKILADKPALYVEPFLGAGAIALALPKTIPMLLNDYSAPLINLWRCIQRTPHLVAAMARACLENLGNTREGYYLARDHFNSLDATVDDGPAIEALERAALMLYLNSTSYNGVWRENKSGGYNVPFGSVKNPAICDVDELLAISDHLGAANITNKSYEDVFDVLCVFPEDGLTVVYADPPYHAGFDDYIAGGFSDEQHEQLADRLFDLANRGVKVYTTNADTPFICKLYKNAIYMDVVMEARNVAQKTPSRKAVNCLLIEV